MLAPSQQVDLNSGERTDAYCCLFPCWSRTDLFSVGKLFYKFHRKDMIERFYYSGGSVCEFTLSTCTDIIEAIDNAISSVNYVSNLLNNKSSISTGGSQVDRLRHTFVKNRRGISPLYSKEWWKPFIFRSCWEQVIDSEYAARCLSLRLRSDALSRIYTWAKNTGNNSLTGAVFEILLHRLAADNQLDLLIIENVSPNESKPPAEEQIAPRHHKAGQVRLKKKCDLLWNGKRLCDPSDRMERWWKVLVLVSCVWQIFEYINSIVKLKSTSNKKGNVAYL